MSVVVKNALSKIFEGAYLDAAEAEELLWDLLSTEVAPVEAGALMAAYRMRGPDVLELSGFLAALQRLCIRLDFPGVETIDVCGTGGDGKETFNISTLTAVVLAGAGVKVVKHGNYGFSSSCGSSNVLEALGVKFSADQDRQRRSLQEAGICFLHAPLFHPALKKVGALRKEFGLRSFFNLLGPLVNPANPTAQFTGVAGIELQRLYAYALERTSKRFLVVHSLDGYDEISLTGSFKVVGPSVERVYEPEELGFTRLRGEELAGARDVADNAVLFRSILEGRGTAAQRAVVLVNAAFALDTGRGTNDFQAALEEASASLESGRALAAFERAVAVSAC